MRVHAAAPGLAVGTTNISASIFVQRHALSTYRIAPIPELGTPDLAQAHDLTAVDLVAGRPVLRAGFFSQAGTMAAIPLWVASPILAGPGLRERHRLAAIGAAAGAPILGLATVGATIAFPRAQSTYAGRFKGPAPALGQVHQLNAPTVTVGPPRALPAVLTPCSVLGTAADLTVSSPALGAPLMGAIAKLVPMGMRYGFPHLGAPQLAQEHVLWAIDLAAGTPQLQRPRVAETRLLPDPIGVEAGAPILGVPDLAQRVRLYAVHVTGKRQPATLVGQRDSKVAIIGRSKRRASI